MRAGRSELGWIVPVSERVTSVLGIAATQYPRKSNIRVASLLTGILARLGISCV